MHINANITSTPSVISNYLNEEAHTITQVGTYGK